MASKARKKGTVKGKKSPAKPRARESSTRATPLAKPAKRPESNLAKPAKRPTTQAKRATSSKSPRSSPPLTPAQKGALTRAANKRVADLAASQLAALRSERATRAAATRAANKRAADLAAAQLFAKRSEAAKKGAETKRLSKLTPHERGALTRKANAEALAAQKAQAKANRSKAQKRVQAKRRTKQLIVTAFNDPRAVVFGLRNVRPEDGRVMADDSKGTKRQLYTVTTKDTKEIRYFWGDANKLEAYTPQSFQELYEDLDPDLFSVEFDFEF